MNSFTVIFILFLISFLYIDDVYAMDTDPTKISQFIIDNYFPDPIDSNVNYIEQEPVDHNFTQDFCNGVDIQCYNVVVGKFYKITFGLGIWTNFYYFENNNDLDNYFEKMNPINQTPDIQDTIKINDELYCEFGKYAFNAYSETGIICKDFPLIFRVYGERRDGDFDAGSEVQFFSRLISEKIMENPISIKSSMMIDDSVHESALNNKSIISSEQTQTKIPEWVKNTFKWYVEGQISETEVLNAIKFLVQNDIIKLDES